MLPDRDAWLDTAVSGIRFGPDRRAVRAELEDHIEDKLAGLRRAFPNIPGEEAQERALSAMGDPEELKTELARVHRPWLGWLWQASQWAVVLLMFVSLCVPRDSGYRYDRSLWGRTSEKIHHRIRDGEQAELGGYTFRIVGAAYVDRPEGMGDVIQVVLRASSPQSWERIDPETVLDCLTAVGPSGTRYEMTGEGHVSSRYTITDALGNTETGVLIAGGGALCRWGPIWREFSLRIPARDWEPGEVVTLRFDSELGGFELSVPVTEEVEER